MSDVPREPTPEMIAAGVAVSGRSAWWLVMIYQAMYDAAPAAPRERCGWCGSTLCENVRCLREGQRSPFKDSAAHE